jgi:hypothetical protein
MAYVDPKAKKASKKRKKPEKDAAKTPKQKPILEEAEEDEEEAYVEDAEEEQDVDEDFDEKPKKRGKTKNPKPTVDRTSSLPEDSALSSAPTTPASTRKSTRAVALQRCSPSILSLAMEFL